MLWEKREAEGVMKNSVSAADYLDWARIATSFTAMAAITEVTADLTGEGDPEKLPVAAVSAPFFEVFGDPAAAWPDLRGRRGHLRPQPRRHPRVTRSGGSASAATPGVVEPLDHAQRQSASRSSACCRRTPRFPTREAQMLSAARASGASRAAVTHLAQLQRVCAAASRTCRSRRRERKWIASARTSRRQYPQLSRGHGAHVTSLPEEITGPVERTLVVLMAAVAFILLIACINVTNLLLAKAAGRRREMAVRAAIGAARARLMRQVLVECAVMALAGGAAGLILAVWSVRVLAAQLPAVARPDQTVIFSLPVLAVHARRVPGHRTAGRRAAGVAPGPRRSRGAAQGRRPQPGQPEARAALRPHRRRGRVDVAAARRRRPHAAKLPGGAGAAGRHRDRTIASRSESACRARATGIGPRRRASSASSNRDWRPSR